MKTFTFDQFKSVQAAMKADAEKFIKNDPGMTALIDDYAKSDPEVRGILLDIIRYSFEHGWSAGGQNAAKTFAEEMSK